MVASRTFVDVKHLDENEKKALFWLIPQVGLRSNITLSELENIIHHLIYAPYFPSSDVINRYVFQKDDFLDISDKYLLVNYITNYTHFAQSYVDEYNISSEQFVKIVDDAKNHNFLPQDFIDYIRSFYSDYYIIDEEINKNGYLNIQHKIGQIQNEKQMAILYARLYVRGDGKYKKYYNYTQKAKLSSEMLIYDKIIYHYKHNNYSRIAKYIAELPQTLHNGELWWNNSQSIIFNLVERGYKWEAYKLLSRIHLNVTHKHYIRKEIFSGAIAMLIENPGYAYEHFHNVYENAQSLDEKTQGAYFIAQSYFKMGNRNVYKYWLQIASKQPTIFYGSRAIDEIHDISPDFLVGGDRYLTTAWKKSIQRKRVLYKKHYDEFITTNIINNQKLYQSLPKHIMEILQIAEILKNSGYIGYAKEFVIQAVKRVEDLSYMNSLLTHVCDSYNKYICTDAKRAAEDVGFIDIQEFKLIKSQDIHDSIQKNHLALLHAVIKKESNFKEIAHSKAGAKGMMQIMPATAKFVCAKYGIKYNYAQLQNNAGYNVYLGTLYLNYLLEKYNGSYVRALAAYNAGHGNVEKWENAYMRAGSYQEMVLMIELIPFLETRNYVRKIIEWEGIYGYILNLRRA